MTAPSRKPERAIVWSYGGGVQSAAIAVLVVQGKLPRPERIVMAALAVTAVANPGSAGIAEPTQEPEG